MQTIETKDATLLALGNQVKGAMAVVDALEDVAQTSRSDGALLALSEACFALQQLRTKQNMLAMVLLATAGKDIGKGTAIEIEGKGEHAVIKLHEDGDDVPEGEA